LITGQIGGGADDDYGKKWGRLPEGRRMGKYILGRTSRTIRIWSFTT